MLDELLSVWRTHESINRYLLRQVSDDGLLAVPLLKNGQPGKGRNVARQFAHLVEARAAFMRAAEKACIKHLPPLAKGETPSRAHLEAALDASSQGIEALFTRVHHTGDKVHGRGALNFLGYLIAHESHHRGQMLLALKQNGFALSEELRWGIWSKWFKD